MSSQRAVFLCVFNLFFLSIPFAGFSRQAAAVDPGIGQILSIHKRYSSGLKVRLNRQDAYPKDRIAEGSVLQTFAGQVAVILMNDGTELTVGPSTRVRFSDWNRRVQGLLRRTLYFDNGVVRLKVRKAYSIEEPFLVVHKLGAVAVRGTEFILEAGPGGRLESARHLSTAELLERRDEIELHTLAGEVDFARSFAELEQAENRVRVFAGQTSLLRKEMTKPQQPHPFDLQSYKTYLSHAFHEPEVTVSKAATNAPRAGLVLNVENSSVLYYQEVPLPGQGRRRGLASDQAETLGSELQRLAPPQSRRGKFLDSSSQPRKKKSERLRNRGMRYNTGYPDAFSGGDG
ncbi:MAG: FecR family protein [Bdellovibrionota bacterium]